MFSVGLLSMSLELKNPALLCNGYHYEQLFIMDVFLKLWNMEQAYNVETPYTHHSY